MINFKQHIKLLVIDTKRIKFLSNSIKTFIHFLSIHKEDLMQHNPDEEFLCSPQSCILR